MRKPGRLTDCAGMNQLLYNDPTLNQLYLKHTKIGYTGQEILDKNISKKVMYLTNLL